MESCISYYLLLFFVVGILQGGLCNFIISPSTQIVTQGDTAIFTCQNSAADSVGWKINQTSIGRLEATTGITAESRVQPDGLLRILKIEGRPEYNASMVECVGFFIGGPSQSSQVVFLLIQGTLDAVGSLSATFVGNFSILITWEAPFSLNLTNTEPDVTYSVLISLDGDGQILQYSVEETVFLYNIIPQHHNFCDSQLHDLIFNITVVPVNGFGQGTLSRVQVQYNDETRVESTISMLSPIGMESHFLLNPGPHWLCNCKLLLVAMGGTIQHVFNESNGLYCDSSSVTFIISDYVLPLNSHYKGSIVLFKKEINISISTYDVQDVMLSIDHNILQVNVNYINNTRAKGAFISLVPISHSNQLLDQQFLDYILPATALMLSTMVPLGIYKILSYDIEEDGLLSMPKATPATVNTVAVLGTSFTFNDIVMENNTNVEVLVTASTSILHHTLKINCKYNKLSDARGCMVIVRSRAQPENLTVKLQSRESVYPLEYYVDSEVSITYLITVFAMGDNGILNSSINTMEILIELESTSTVSNHNLDVYKIISGTALSILSLIIVIIFVVFFGMKLKVLCNTTKKTENSTAIEMQTCEAYEVISIQRRRR